MDAASHFHSLEELIRALDRERKLLYALFQDRKRLSFRYNLAKELATKKDESLEFLRRFGIIHENGDFVELEDVYLKFFEEVLEVNEEREGEHWQPECGYRLLPKREKRNTKMGLSEGCETHSAQHRSNNA